MGYHGRKCSSQYNNRSCCGWIVLVIMGWVTVGWAENPNQIMGKNARIHTPEAPTGLAFDESTEITQAIGQLADLSSAKRAAAETFLMRQNAVALGQVAEMLGQCQDLEQRARLRKVTIHLFLKSILQIDGIGGGNAVVGIVLIPEKARFRSRDITGNTGWVEKPCVTFVSSAGSTTIQDVPIWLPLGLPSAECLQEGDKILGVENEPITKDGGVVAFRKQITSRAPGSIVKLRILRQGREQWVEVQLVGSVNNSDPVLVKRAHLVNVLLERLEGRDRIFGGETQLIEWEEKGVVGINRFPVEQRIPEWFICPMGS